MRSSDRVKLTQLRHHHHNSLQTGKGLVNKRFIKLIATCPNNNIRRALVKLAPEGTIKGICNAALNVARNPNIKLFPATRTKLARHRNQFNKLLSKKGSIHQKRHTILQKGGFLPILAPILSTILGAVGSALFNCN